MSAAQHTPGPWEVRDARGPEYAGLNVDGPCDSRGVVPVAMVYLVKGRSANEQAANARLIAAAPDLHALVEELADMDHGIVCRVRGHAAALDDDCDCWCCDWTRRARAALAKAAGGEP